MFSVRFDLREKLQGIQLGATDYITKPFVHDDLIRRVHRLLERPRV
jgi:DNA-binding response OmpR family regulator